MSKTLTAIILAAAMSTAAPVVSTAEAGGARHYHGGRHHAYNHRHGRHHGRGYYRNGKWIALGILGAAVGAAIADSEYRDCYYRHGRRYCY